MRIISKQYHKTPSSVYFNVGIQTSFEPTEIIALRADGTSESTNPESMEMRELDKQRQIAAAMNVVSDQVSADFMGIVDNRDAEIERLKSELKSANKNLQTTRSVIQGAKAFNENAAKQYKGALGNVLGCDGEKVLQKATELASELSQAKADYAGLAKRHDELSAINVENYHNAIQAKAELERLKTQFSPPKPIFNMAAQTVYGMTLDEVRGMKYQLAANREQIDAANARVASVSADLYNTEDMNKKLLARLELIRSRLGCQFGAIEMKVYELQQVQCKLEAVTRALEG